MKRKPEVQFSSKGGARRDDDAARQQRAAGKRTSRRLGAVALLVLVASALVVAWRVAAGLVVMTAGGGAAGAESDALLTLVNPDHPVPEDWRADPVKVEGQYVDRRAATDLKAMLAAARAEGLEPLICSGYRTQEKQTQLFDNKLSRCMAQGLSAEDAAVEAALWVARPGTSEHQLGLAVDIVSRENQNLDDSQADTPAQQWLMAHCWEYGFIFRYPKDKTDVTKIGYEPWHYRYVGRTAAKEITSLGVCLEEYLAARD